MPASPCASFRTQPRAGDVAAIQDIVVSTGFFYPHEVDVAVELVETRLREGEASGYFFVFAEDGAGRTIGYACYGPVPCTIGSFDLYWIAVHQDCRGGGLGRSLLKEVESRVALARGRRIYIETSSRPMYEPTRSFYRRCGYAEEARMVDFYDDGDDKIIYSRRVGLPCVSESCDPKPAPTPPT
jgi:GNAT superfamily N-acetyltransferase